MRQTPQADCICPTAGGEPSTRCAGLECPAPACQNPAAWCAAATDSWVRKFNASQMRPRTNYIAKATEALASALRDLGKDPTKSLTPDLQQLYVLLVLTRGTETTLADVHNAWACARAITRPDHADLVPFEQLSDDVAEWDRPFMQAIHEAARALSV